MLLTAAGIVPGQEDALTLLQQLPPVKPVSAGDQVGRRQPVQCHVHPPLLQLLQDAAADVGDEGDLHLRMGIKIGHHRVEKAIGVDPGSQPHPQGLHRAGRQLPGHLLKLLPALGHLPGALAEALPLRRQAHSLGRTQKQGTAQLLLQLPHLLGQGGLGEKQVLRRPGEILIFCHRQNIQHL